MITFINHNKTNIVKIDGSLKMTVLKIVDEIIDDLIRQKEKEGAEMLAVLVKLLNMVEKEAKKIVKLTPIIKRQKREIFMERLNELGSKLKQQQDYNELKKTLIGLFLQKTSLKR